MVERQNKWFDEWCQPVIQAMYHRDKRTVEDTIARAYAALDSGDVCGEIGACLEYQLAYLEFQAQPILKTPQWRESVLPQLVAILARSSDLAIAERVRRRLYIQIRILLDRMKVDPLDLKKFKHLLTDIPEEDNSTEMWHLIAEWAFRHNHIKVLEEAYEFMVLQAKGFNEVWCWHRVSLMLKIARGTAIERNVNWLIDQAQIGAHLNSLQIQIWPRAEILGIITDATRHRFQARAAELEGNVDSTINSYLKPHIK